MWICIMKQTAFVGGESRVLITGRKLYWKDQLAQEGSLRSLKRKGDLAVVLKENTCHDYAQSPSIYTTPYFRFLKL